MRFLSGILALGLVAAASAALAAAPSAAPTQLLTTPGNTVIGLTWAPLPLGEIVTGYNIYNYKSSTSTPVATSANPWGVITDLENGTTYTLTVAAYNTNTTTGHDDGPRSMTISATPIAPPAAPGGLAAALTQTPAVVVQLSWNPAQPGTSSITGYNVYRATAPVFPAQAAYAFVTGASNSILADANINTAGSFGNYYYWVAALDALGNTGAISAQAVVPLFLAGSPGAPAALSGTAVDGGVQLVWNPPGTTVDAYAVIYTRTPGINESVTYTAGTSYQVSLPNDGQPYYFSVAGISAGIWGDRANLPARTLPPPVTTLTSHAGSNYVLLSWVAPDGSSATGVSTAGILGYHVYADPVNNPPTLLAETLSATLTSYAYTTTTADVINYRVSAFNNSVNDNPGGNTVSLAVNPSNLLPAVPTGFTATVGISKSVTLRWNLNPPGDTVTAYTLFSVKGLWALPASLATTTIADGLSNGTLYQFVLTAVNSAGEASVTVTAVPLAVPAALNAQVLGNNVQLSWITQDQPSGASYRLYRTDFVGSSPVLLTATAAQAFTDTQPPNNTYYYKLAIFNALGQPLPDSQALTTTATISVPPLPPGQVSLVPGNGQVQIIWQTITNASTYRLYRRHNADPEQLLPITLGAKATHVEDTGLANKEPYYYSMTAVNDAGESTRTAESLAIPFVSAILPANASVRTSSLRHNISLEWNLSTKGDYLISGYNIYRSEDGGSFKLLLNALGNSPTVDAVSTTITVYRYQDANLKYAKTYFYLIHAVDQHGNEGSAYQLASVSLAQPENQFSIYRNAFNPAKGESAPMQLMQVQPGRVRMKIYNLSGEYVRTLFDQDLPAGYSPDYPFVMPLTWNGKNDQGQIVASGVYMVHVEGGSHFHQTRKVAVIK